MVIKRHKITLTILIVLLCSQLNSREPFVVLESSHSHANKKINSKNKFLKNNNHFVIHEVKFGDSLSKIINKYYKNTGLNKKIIEISIIEINKKAFVRDNPNYLFAGQKIRVPSINEIKNLVIKKPNNKKASVNSKSDQIYFFGSN